MQIQDYLHDPRLRPLFRFLDLSVSARQRMVLLGLGAGFTERELGALPGLRNPSRTREAVEELEAAGRVRRTDKGWEAVPVTPPSDQEIMDRIRRWKKLRTAFGFLREPSARLRARGLGHVAEELGPALSAALEEVLHVVDRRMPRDQAIRRTERLSVLHFVRRNLPPEYAALCGGGDTPPPAPADICGRTLRRLTAGLSRAQASGIEQQVHSLYRALLGRGEVVLAHWWQILDALWEAGYRGAPLRQEWRERLESYLMRSRVKLSKKLRLSHLEPRKLKARYPVPDCGYGPWVEDELRLYQAFRARYGPALGPAVKNLWIRAHQAVPHRLREDYPFAGPHTVGRERYEEALLQEADALSRLTPEMLRDLKAGRRNGAIKASRQRAFREAHARSLRLAVAKAARAAQDDRLRKGKDVAWAVRLLRLAAEMKAGKEVEGEELERCVGQSRRAGRGGRRYQKEKLAEQALRILAHEVEAMSPTQGPAEPFPMQRIALPVARALRRIGGQTEASPSERDAALKAVKLFLERRAIVTVAYGTGAYEQMTVEKAATLVGGDSVLPTLLSLVWKAGTRSEPPEVLAA